MDWHSGGYGPSGHPPASQHHQHAHGVTGQPSFPEQHHVRALSSERFGAGRDYGARLFDRRAPLPRQSSTAPVSTAPPAGSKMHFLNESSLSNSLK